MEWLQEYHAGLLVILSAVTLYYFLNKGTKENRQEIKENRQEIKQEIKENRQEISTLSTKVSSIEGYIRGIEQAHITGHTTKKTREHV